MPPYSEILMRSLQSTYTSKANYSLINDYTNGGLRELFLLSDFEPPAGATLLAILMVSRLLFTSASFLLRRNENFLRNREALIICT